MTAVDGMKQLAKPWYSDQILPFDITLAGASELGAATAMKIFGVEILNEGSGVSIVAAEVTKVQATFVARTRCFATKWIFSSLTGGGSIVVDRRVQPWPFSLMGSYGLVLATDGCHAVAEMGGNCWKVCDLILGGRPFWMPKLGTTSLQMFVKIQVENKCWATCWRGSSERVPSELFGVRNGQIMVT